MNDPLSIVSFWHSPPAELEGAIACHPDPIFLLNSLLFIDHPNCWAEFISDKEIRYLDTDRSLLAIYISPDQIFDNCGLRDIYHLVFEIETKLCEACYAPSKIRGGIVQDFCVRNNIALGRLQHVLERWTKFSSLSSKEIKGGSA